MTTHIKPAQWQRSSYCGNGACVEIATGEAHRYMRDAKETDGEILSFSNAAWGSFVAGVKGGRIGRS